jgi:superoxide dismutase, Cu-Zn family
MTKFAYALTLGLFAGACTTFAGAQDKLVGGASISTPDGTRIGTAVLTEDAQGLKLTLVLTGLTPGSIHGLHLHAVGACQGPAFASAGPHLNPAGRQHGADNPAGSHLGDLPNLTINSAGAGRLIVRLSGDPRHVQTQLFDSDGTAIVLHADPDDLRTDPSGNSGVRIACGALLPAAR